MTTDAACQERWVREKWKHTQADSQHILSGPIHQVQVEVVLQRRRIQHLQRNTVTDVMSGRSEPWACMLKLIDVL